MINEKTAIKFLSYKNDISKFAKECLKIELTLIQREALNAMCQGSTIINGKRCTGKSTVLLIYSLWVSLFYQNKKIAIICGKYQVGSFKEEIITGLQTANKDLNGTIDIEIDFSKISVNSSISIMSASDVRSGNLFDEILIDTIDFVNQDRLNAVITRNGKMHLVQNSTVNEWVNHFDYPVVTLFFSNNEIPNTSFYTISSEDIEKLRIAALDILMENILEKPTIKKSIRNG